MELEIVFYEKTNGRRVNLAIFHPDNTEGIEAFIAERKAEDKKFYFRGKREYGTDRVQVDDKVAEILRGPTP